MSCLISFALFSLISYYYWEKIPSPSIKAAYHSVVYDPVNDLFFVIGGDTASSENETKTHSMDICLEFDPKTNTWDTKEPMPIKRARHRAAYRKDFIHVLCGKDDYGNHINSHVVYDIESNSWDTAASAPMAVARTSVVTWRDSLVYLMGGYASGARTEVYLYDAATNSWDTATSLPRPLHAGGTDIKGDSIFTIGGADGSSYYSRILIGEINPADPTEINWSWGDSLPLASNGFNGMAIKNNKAYMIGGDFDNGTNEVWEYDIQNGTWTSLPDYPTNIIHRGHFAQRRDGPDSLGVIYCFMGDTAVSSGRSPTDECFRLTSAPFSGIDEEEKLEKNSVSLNSTINLTGEIAINCNIRERCDLKIDMYDVSGRQVFSHLEKNIPTGQHQLTIKENLKNGIYFIQIEAGPTVAFEKVILIR